jgi:thiamine pyrophosphokinase
MAHKSAVILCDGRKPPKKEFIASVNKSGLFIAADGGANIANKLNIKPDVIIGDFDSYKPVDQKGVTIIRDSDQETNDLEKALNYILNHNINHVEIYGAFGQRLDHTLKNLSVLKRYNDKFRKIVFIDKYGVSFLLPPHYTARLPVGTTVSLYPLKGSVEGISTKGLEFSLDSETLEIGKRDGTSNKTLEDQVEITHESGDLLIFIATLKQDH